MTPCPECGAAADAAPIPVTSDTRPASVYAASKALTERVTICEGRDLGIATAAYRLVQQVGVAFGIALLTGIYGPSGYQPAFVAGGAMALFALTAAAFMKRDKRHQH